MEIIYSSSDSYARIAAVSIVSLCENNQDEPEINIHVIGNGIRPDNSNELKRIAAAYGRSLEVVELPDLNKLAMVKIVSRQYNIATFARLYLGPLLPNIDRAIFIDCDTLVVGSLKALWETQLERGMLIAGSLDAVSCFNKRRIGLDADDTYINVGVLLADLDLWRRERIHEQFFNFLRERNGSVPIVDQGVINAVASRRIQALSAQYNVMAYILAFSYFEMKRYKKPRKYYDKRQYDTAKAAPVIVHATNHFLIDRPWLKGSNHPYAGQWLRYYELTKWKDQPLDPYQVSFIDRTLRALCATPLRWPVLETLGVLQSTVKK